MAPPLQEAPRAYRGRSRRRAGSHPSRAKCDMVSHGAFVRNIRCELEWEFTSGNRVTSCTITQSIRQSTNQAQNCAAHHSIHGTTRVRCLPGPHYERSSKVPDGQRIRSLNLSLSAVTNLLGSRTAHVSQAIPRTAEWNYTPIQSIRFKCDNSTQRNATSSAATCSVVTPTFGTPSV